jgi:hypothetical protein
MSEDPMFVGKHMTIWVAAIDTPAPENPGDVYDPDGPWQLISPVVPDKLPKDLSDE